MSKKPPKKLPDRKIVDGKMRCGFCEKVLEKRIYVIDSEIFTTYIRCPCGVDAGYYYNGCEYHAGGPA